MISFEQYVGVAGEPVFAVARTETGDAPAILAKLAEIAFWLRVSVERGEAGSPPTLSLRGSRPHGAISYVGPIEGRMLEPLVEVLRALATGEVDFETPATPARVREL